MSFTPINFINHQKRRTEIANLLAFGILRHKIRLNHQKEEQHSYKVLDFKEILSIHADNKQPKT